MDDQATRGDSPGWRSSVHMPFAVDGIPAQRHQLVRDLVQHALPTETAYDAAVVLAELVTNAVQHGEPLPDDSLDVLWGAWGGLVHVEVTDGGAITEPVAAAAPVVAVSGRGLAIVAALATAWGVRTEPTTVTVWAALPASRSAA